MIKRNILWTTAFKRDYKREKKNHKKLDVFLAPVLSALAADELLDARYCDHQLTGDKKFYRDCHVKPDLILLYQKTDEDVLILVRLGSHSELSL